jgi:hypothetical protein
MSIPKGWKIEQKNDLFKTIEITAPPSERLPHGASAVVTVIDRNPACVLYDLAKALIEEKA